METVQKEAILIHGRHLYHVAYGILRDAEGAEDACQQAFLKAWDQRSTLRDPEAIRAWLTKVVINESFQLLRRRRLEKRALSEGHWGRIPEEHPAHEIDARESVLGALEKLEEPTRTIVILRVMRGMSGNEVRTLLNCSASEVSRRLHEGMDRLRIFLSEWQPTGGGMKS